MEHMYSYSNRNNDKIQKKKKKIRNTSYCKHKLFMCSIST